MPPVASPLFVEAQTTYEGITRRLKDLGEYQIPRLRECKGPLSLQQQFAAELRDDTEALAKRLEDFATLAEDQERENERVQVRKWVSGLYDELTKLKTESRTALLTSKRAIDNDARSRRDELLGSAALQQKRAADAEAHKQRATEDKLMAASDDVTEALRRTTRLMQQELERSVLSTQMLEESSKTLRATSDAYMNMDNLMDVSQVLIKALQRADWMDRIIIGLSFGVFLLTMAYIVKRRVVDRVVSVVTLPVRLAVGSPKSASSSLTEVAKTVKTLATSLAASVPTESVSSTTNTLSSSATASMPTASDSFVSIALDSPTPVSNTLETLETSAMTLSAHPTIGTLLSKCSDAACSIIERSVTADSLNSDSSVAPTSVLSVARSAIHQEL